MSDDVPDKLGQPDPAPQPVPEDQYDEFVFRRLLDEVYLLMDFVSGRPDKSITALTGIRVPTSATANPGADAATTTDDIITHISTLRFPPPQMQPLTARNAAFLLIVKDRLNRMASPAIGLTIAFTAMVVGSVREPASGMPEKPLGKRASTRLSLAAEAYPGLIRPANTLRRIIIGGITMMLLLTVFTAYTSGVASFGRSLLDRVDETIRARAVIAEAIKAIENAKSSETTQRQDIGTAACSAGKCTPDLSAVVFRLCERPKVLLWRFQEAHVQLPQGDNAQAGAIDIFENATQRQVCDQMKEAEQNIASAYRDVIRFKNGHLAVYASPITFAASFFTDRFVIPPDESTIWIASVLSALSSYVLPMCFTLLGTGVSIVRDIYDKVHESTLAPRDIPLSFGRLALGMVAGAAIGLFYSPSQVPLQGAGGLTGSLTLSAQGLAFLAGYGVDSVFAVFDGLLRRLSAAAQQPVQQQPVQRPSASGSATATGNG
jgi:hypothetical protein